MQGGISPPTLPSLVCQAELPLSRRSTLSKEPLITSNGTNENFFLIHPSTSHLEPPAPGATVCKCAVLRRQITSKQVILLVSFPQNYPKPKWPFFWSRENSGATQCFQPLLDCIHIAKTAEPVTQEMGKPRWVQGLTVPFTLQHDLSYKHQRNLLSEIPLTSCSTSPTSRRRSSRCIRRLEADAFSSPLACLIHLSVHLW